jgi:hypothetical protein
VSALAQLIELHGIPTVVIGLVRIHMEKVQPPRGLWTPFQLGRPLGEPEDRRFQNRVLMQALSLLERTDGPVILEDFPEDPPNWFDRVGWRPPFTLAGDARAATPGDWQESIANEIFLLAPHWARAQERFRRTTVGLSGLPPEAWPAFMVAFLTGELPPAPVPHLTSSALALRFTIDDLKAYYTESAQGDGQSPASRQLDAWFWRETVAGNLIRALRIYGMESENNALKTASARFFVPAPWLMG